MTKDNVLSVQPWALHKCQAELWIQDILAYAYHWKLIRRIMLLFESLTGEAIFIILCLLGVFFVWKKSSLCHIIEDYPVKGSSFVRLSALTYTKLSKYFSTFGCKVIIELKSESSQRDSIYLDVKIAYRSIPHVVV